jgi:hypothetical protein
MTAEQTALLEQLFEEASLVPGQGLAAWLCVRRRFCGGI